MRLRTLIIAAALVGGFVYITARPNSFVRRGFSSSAPLWSGPSVARSAGLGSDELNNIEIYKATVLVRDRPDDLALIKIEPKKKLPHLSLGDSDRLQVGQKVLAIGNPFGFAGTLTTGVVSSLGRDIHGENGQVMEAMIQ